MAIATLERCYNNPNVITGVVKIRKGEAVKLMMAATNMTNVKRIFQDYTSRVFVTKIITMLYFILIYINVNNMFTIVYISF